MTSGQKHDKATTILCIPFSLLIGVFLGIQSAVIAGISFILGGLWLSPDLDIRSLCLKRWGYLKFFWWPYRKFISHRSFLSHGPFIGSILRITYLIAIAFILKILIQALGIEVPFISINQLKILIAKYPEQVLAIAIGVEASAWLHLILDGDPLPIKLKKSKT